MSNTTPSLAHTPPHVIICLNFSPSASGRLVSGCPQEKGVVKTKWGSISPGHLIAGVASALQETHETYETIYSTMAASSLILASSLSTMVLSNVWIATVAGDLGEIVVYQASERPIVGNEGYWNDTIFPRLYVSAGGAQELTDAELLGGIDGECSHYLISDCHLHIMTGESDLTPKWGFSSVRFF